MTKKPQLRIDVQAAAPPEGASTAPAPRMLRNSKSMGDFRAAGASSEDASSGPMSVGPRERGFGAFDYATDLHARCSQAKQITNRQLRHLLKLPEMRGASESRRSSSSDKRTAEAAAPALSEEQRQAAQALRQLAEAFIDHEDVATAGLLCQQLMKSAHELRLPLAGVAGHEINLSTHFVLALTPCARLLPAQQHLLTAGASAEDDGLEGLEEDAEGPEEGHDAEAVLQRFYQRWQQSGAAWSHRISRRHSTAVAPPFVGLSTSLPAADVLVGAMAADGGGRVLPLARGSSCGCSPPQGFSGSFADFPMEVRSIPPTPSVTPKVPRRRGSAPSDSWTAAIREVSARRAERADSRGHNGSPEWAPRRRGSGAPALQELDILAAGAHSPLDRSLEACPPCPKGDAGLASSNESSFNSCVGRERRSAATPTSVPMSPAGLRRSTMVAAAPLLLCRICERMINADQLEQHSKQCLLEVVVFTAEQRLEKLRDLLTREIEQRPIKADEPGSAGARQAGLLHLLLQTVSEALSLDMDEERSAAMLRDAKELQNESLRLADPLLVPLAEQLHTILDQLQPFWREEHHGSLHRAASDAHQHQNSLAQAAKGVSINSFEILKPISRGAYGRVLLAAKRTTRDLYAIKVVRKRDMRRKNQVHRIKVEREVMAEANHPFLVKLFYSFQTAEKLYMVMEFVNGGDLYSLLQNVGYLAEEVVRLYVAEVSLALEYLHCDLGVVHRDLKPDNVLIDEDGHIKLTDFGLSVLGMASADEAHEIVPESSEGRDSDAQRKTDPMAEAHEEELREKVGTPDYMAPEVLLGERHGTPVDLWALGCLTFELLTGYTPFTGEKVEQIFEHVLEHAHTDTIRWPEEEEHLSPEAVDFVRALLEPLSERRLGGAGTHEAFGELRDAPFLCEVDWDSLHSREALAPFVPTLEGSEDVSYFVSKPQPDSCGLVSAPSTPMPVHAARQSSVEGADAGAEGDVDFLNFTFNGLTNLMQRNLEIARAEGKNSPRGNSPHGGTRESSPNRPTPPEHASGSGPNSATRSASPEREPSRRSLLEPLRPPASNPNKPAGLEPE